jgi:replication factor C subunit 3/5
MSMFADVDKLKKKSSLPWTEKYRPDFINQIVSHETHLRILQNQIIKKNFPHIVLYGPPGTGKTTTILACARKMFGDTYKSNILELNGSNDRGVSVVRNIIDGFSQHELYTNTQNIQKLVILDEADSMTHDAQTALQCVIEKYTETTRFCLICNYNTKIIGSLRSLCTILNFEPIPVTLHKEHLEQIVTFEKMNVNDAVMDEIISLSNGDMRQSINTLQSLSMAFGSEIITMEILCNNISQIPPQKMKQMIDMLLDNSNNIDFMITYLKQLETKESMNILEIINIIVKYILQHKIYDNMTLASVLVDLETIEHNISVGASSNIQICGVASALCKANKQKLILDMTHVPTKKSKVKKKV